MTKRLVRLLAVLISFILFTEIVNINGIIALAGNKGNTLTVKDGGDYDGDDDDEFDDYYFHSEYDPNTYNLVVDKSYYVFPTVEEGDYELSRFTITNMSSCSVNLGWSITDPYVFSVSTPYSLWLAPNEKTEFDVATLSTLNPGQYSATLTIWALEDTSRISTVSIYMTVTVTEEKDVPVVTSVMVNPSSATIQKGDSHKFDANIQGENLIDTSVSWSITGANSSNTGIDNNGNLSIGRDESSTNIRVIATSNQDPSVSGYSNVTVSEGNINISVQADDNTGGVVTGGGTYTRGSDVTLNASPNNGFIFTGWTLDGNQVATTNMYVVRNAQSNQNYVAHFKRNTAYVQTSMNPASGAGTITGSANVTCGNSMTVTASPATGYRFVAWKENGNVISTNASFTLTNINSDRNIVAYFEKSGATVQASMTINNAGTVTGAGTYNLGSRVTLKATPYAGYVFTGWFSNNQLITRNAEYTIDNISHDYCVVAGFARQDSVNYTITADTNTAGGSISPKGSITVPYGSSFTYSITPLPGYKVSQVIVDGVNVGDNTSYTFTNVTSDHVIRVNFEAKPQDVVNPVITPAGQNNTAQNTPTTTTTPTANPSTSPDNSQQSQAEVMIPENVDYDNIPQDLYADNLVDNVDPNYNAYIDTSDVNYNDLTGILRLYSITRDEAKMMLEAGQGGDMFYQAYLHGYIQMTVNNDYASNMQATASGDFFTNPSLPNYNEVMEAVFTEDELLDALEGKPIQVNVDVTRYTDDVPWYDKRAVEVLADEYGVQVEDYFDISVIKTTDGISQQVSDFGDTEAIFVFQLPSNLIGQDLKLFHIHRNDDGTIEKFILEDLDNDPATFTISVSKLSIFAFVKDYEHPVWITILKIVGIIIIIGLMVLVVYVIVRSIKVARRRRRKSLANKKDSNSIVHVKK